MQKSKITLSIDSEVCTKFKETVVKCGTNMSEVIQDFMFKYNNEHSQSMSNSLQTWIESDPQRKAAYESWPEVQRIIRELYAERAIKKEENTDVG